MSRNAVTTDRSRTLRLATGVLLGLGGLAAPAAPQEIPHRDLQLTLQAHLDSLIAVTDIPGISIGVAMPDGTSFGLAAGVSDREDFRRMAPDDRMLQGSVGKTYFLAAALQLVEEGRLGLDDPLAEYLGDREWFDRLPNAPEVTIRHLMRHQSGIVRYELSRGFLREIGRNPMRSFTPEERLAFLFDEEAPFSAGEGWEYSDTNYILLAMVVEEITGRATYDVIRERILEPLELEETVPSDSPRVPGLVNGYAGGAENPFGGFDRTLEDGRLVMNPQFEWGGGGFASSSQDLARWMQDLHIARVFDPDLLDEMYDGVPAPLGPNAAYGLGTIMMGLPTSGTAFGHSGFMPGYRTEAYYFPDYGFALALMLNTTASGAFEGPLLLLFDAIAHKIVMSPGL